MDGWINVAWVDLSTEKDPVTVYCDFKQRSGNEDN